MLFVIFRRAKTPAGDKDGCEDEDREHGDDREDDEDRPRPMHLPTPFSTHDQRLVTRMLAFAVTFCSFRLRRSDAHERYHGSYIATFAMCSNFMSP